jgi:pyrroline-5-carboxylate reductase
MTTTTIGFIGGGRVTGIILEGWRRQNALPADIVVSDCNAETYLWFQLQALREVAAGFGLDETEIARGLEQMIGGAVATLLESGLDPAAVMDLIPVKPLAEMEPQASEFYHTRLPALYQKIKP